MNKHAKHRKNYAKIINLHELLFIHEWMSATRISINMFYRGIQIHCFGVFFHLKTYASILSLLLMYAPKLYSCFFQLEDLISCCGDFTYYVAIW